MSINGMILGWVGFRIAWFLSYDTSSRPVLFLLSTSSCISFIYLIERAKRGFFLFVFLAFFFLALSAHLRNWYFFPVSIRVLFVYLASVVSV